MCIQRHSVVVNVLTWERFANLLYHQVFCQLKYPSTEDTTRNDIRNMCIHCLDSNKFKNILHSVPSVALCSSKWLVMKKFLKVCVFV